MMHPENTLDLFALGGISEEKRKTLYSLDMGAGDGSSGCSVCIDLVAPEQSAAQPPRRVIHADMLALPFPDETFDFVLSQCAFYVSGNPELALREALRVLKPGGKLLLSDVFFIDPDRTPPWNRRITSRDITEQWREYYFRLLWDDKIPPCFENIMNREKHAPRYYMLVYQKEKF